MKFPLLLAFLISSYVQAGIVQEHFLEFTRKTKEVTITHFDAKEKKTYNVLNTKDEKLILEVISAFSFIDPKEEFTPEGEKIITGPCFCAAPFQVTFEDKDGMKRTYPIHEHYTVTVTDDHGLSYATDVELSPESRKKLKKLLKKRQ